MSNADRGASTRQAYDAGAVDFAERTAGRSATATRFFERFRAGLVPGALVVDAGCGPGHDVGRLAAAGHQPLALDVSLGLLKLCPPNSRLVQADLRSLPLRSAGVDGIWSTAALLHIDSSDLADTFAEWNRVLRPGGLAGIATSLASETEPNQGWEIVPAGPDRRPEIADGCQRWFAHHSQAALVDAVEGAGWIVMWSRVRSSYRDWLQLLVRRPA